MIKTTNTCEKNSNKIFRLSQEFYDVVKGGTKSSFLSSDQLFPSIAAFLATLANRGFSPSEAVREIFPGSDTLPWLKNPDWLDLQAVVFLTVREMSKRGAIYHA